MRRNSGSPPVSAWRPSRSLTDSCCRSTFGRAENWRLTPPAHRPVDCDPSVSRSTTTTRAPRRARWYAIEHPITPPPTITASAERLTMPNYTLLGDARLRSIRLQGLAAIPRHAHLREAASRQRRRERGRRRDGRRPLRHRLHL